MTFSLLHGKPSGMSPKVSEHAEGLRIVVDLAGALDLASRAIMLAKELAEGKEETMRLTVFGTWATKGETP